ncbi:MULTISPECIES: CHAD domain-containing protein [unclassified Curtobacterium]|uniref:CHAD domain-containing protein n=1 Tax=unclassified Curtobacterium TaxID=257496 RepID=UPI00226B659F|nr:MULTISPECIES: CHAD domain-containing protein [unclassified Curtobacterium]
MDTPNAPSDTTAGALAEPRRSWRIPDDRRLPALEPYAHAVERTPPLTARETLWDTAGRTLAFAGVELLRAEGPAGDGAGPGVGAGPGAGGGADGDGVAGAWSIDRGDGPVPLPLPLDGAGQPGPPRDAVEVFLRGQPLQVVRVRDTSTTLVVLRGKDGRVRAEVADVRVDEGDPDTALLRSARWWALTDDGDPGSVSRAVERALLDAAEDPGRGPNDPVPRLAPVRRPAVDTSRRPRRGTAAAFVREVVAGLRAELVTIDPRVRADEREAVHELRKVLRRLRSVLAVFRGALDRDATEQLRGRLAEVGGVAGAARDAEVLLDRLLRSASRAPAGYVDARTLDRLGARFEDHRRTTAAELWRVMGSAVWFQTLDALDDLVETAPPGPHATDTAATFVTKRIRRERRRVLALLEDPLAGSGAGDQDLEVLHGQRKGARRLRYALQAAGDTADLGKRRLGRLRRVQDTLGDALDAAHAAEAHRRAATGDARAASESGAFGIGVLATTERLVVERQVAEGRRLLARLGAALRG